MKPGNPPMGSHEIRVQLKFGLKDPTVLYQLKESIGSSVGVRTHKDGKQTYYWSSTSQTNAKKVFAYFKNHSPQGSKWLSFIKWHKILLCVLDKTAKDPKVFQEIVELKQGMNLDFYNPDSTEN